MWQIFYNMKIRNLSGENILLSEYPDGGSKKCDNVKD
jgi:hypothetical protein